VGYAVLIHSYEDKLTSENASSRDWGQLVSKTPFQVGVNKATCNGFLLLGMFKKRETTTVGILGC